MSSDVTSASPGPLSFEVARCDDPTPPEQIATVLADPGFGTTFTDHMVVATWTPEQGWHDATVRPYGPFSLDPAAAVLHYAQEIFEGMKAYRHADGSIWTFRPEANAARFARSARRLALPEMSEGDFIESLRQLVTVDQQWVPAGDEGEKSLYLRPFMFASEAFLGVRPARRITYSVIASPAGAYFTGGLKPVTLWISTDYARAGRTPRKASEANMNGRRYRLFSPSSPAGTHCWSTVTSWRSDSMKSRSLISGSASRRAERAKRAALTSGRKVQIEPSAWR